MHWQYSPYTLPLILVGAVSASLSLYAWFRRAMPGAKTFALMMLCLGFWSTTAGLQAAGADPETQFFWNKAQYLAIVLTPTTWLFLALQYTGRVRKLTPRYLLVFSVVPVVISIMVWTNDLHHLFWSGFSQDSSRGFLALTLRHGPLFWVHTGYCYLLMLIGSLLLVRGLVRAPLVYRSQVRALLVAVTVPWVANILYLAGFNPYPHLDPTPFALIVSTLSFGWGLFRFGLLDLVPVAREAVIEGMADGVAVLDGRGRFLDMNPAARRLLGPDDESLIGQPSEVVLAGRGELLEAFGAAAGTSREVHLGEGEGSRSYEVVVSALQERPGRSGGRLVVLRDVTARQRAEEALRRQNLYLAALLESSRVINSGLALPTVLRNIAEESSRLIGADPGGVGLVRGEQVFFEHVWVRDHWEDSTLAFGLGEGIAGTVAVTRRSYIVNDVWSDPIVVRPEEIEKNGAAGVMGVPIIDRGGSVTGVLTINRRPGAREFTEADSQIIESLARQAAIAVENAALYGALEEKKQKIAESLWAIEQLYRHEQQMTRRLQELDLMKTNFMIVTSHEMRTPLTLLRGYLETLLEGYLGAPTTPQRQALAVCKKTVDRMISSFNDILEMLQLDERRVTLNRCPVDVPAVAREVLEELGTFLDRRRQRVTLDAGESVPQVVADPEKLRLVLVNLVENAMKFTPDDGEIRVGIRRLGDSLQVTVEDNGIGIDASELERIFEEFYTSPDSLHHRSGSYQFEARGAGLGLAIARGHVEAHGGRVWAESDGRGRGSRFHVILPLEAERQAVAS